MKGILKWLGFERQSKYVKDYYYAANIRSSIYMSIVIIVLEVWMIFRLTKKIFENNLQSKFMYLFEKYYSNYLLLLANGIIMLVFAIRFTKGKTTNRVIGVIIQWVFTIICICFGIKISLNDYQKGEQVLTFLTMELFSLGLLTWRPYVSFSISSVSFLYFYYRMNELVAHNTGQQGVTEATRINFFIMWISTMLVCITKYNNIRVQALKDENLVEVNTYLSKISVEDELTGIHNMVYFRTEAEKLLSYVTTDRENIIFLFFWSS